MIEIKKKKTPEDYKKEWEDNEVIVEEEGEMVQYNSFGTKPLYHSPKFLKRLAELYTDMRNFNAVTKTLRNEFNCKISNTTVQGIYYRECAKVLNTDEKSSEFFEDSFKQMKARWKDAWDMVGDLVIQYRRLRKKLMEKEDSTEQALMFLKLTPTITQIADTIRKQLEYIQNQNEQIKVQQTNLIYSPIQITQHLHKSIKTLVNNGYIKILKRIPELEEDLKKDTMKSYDSDRFKQILKETFKEEKWKHSEGADQKSIVWDFIQCTIKKIEGGK